MANSKTKGAATATTDNVDDLLGSTDTTQIPQTDAQLNSTEAIATDAAVETPEQKKARIDAEVKALQDQIKAKKAEAKGEKPKVERTLKGHMVTFRNKSGEQVTGLGTLYYVTRMNGKLFYKEASQVAVLPEGWKEGDALPALPGELPEGK